jgi:hypothetical protein
VGGDLFGPEAPAGVVLALQEGEEGLPGLAGERVLATLGGLVGPLEELGEGGEEVLVGAEGVLLVEVVLPGVRLVHPLGELLGQFGDVLEQRILTDGLASAGGVGEGFEKGHPLGGADASGQGTQEGAQLFLGAGLQPRLDGLAKRLERQLV